MANMEKEIMMRYKKALDKLKKEKTQYNNSNIIPIDDYDDMKTNQAAIIVYIELLQNVLEVPTTIIDALKDASKNYV